MRKDNVLKMSSFQMKTYTSERDQTGETMRKRMSEMDRPIIATGLSGITKMH